MKRTIPLAILLAVAAPASAQVVLNEVYYDAPSSDDGQTFVEIAGPAGTDLSGWSIVSVEAGASTSCGQVNVAVVLPFGATIGPDGLYVVADLAGGTTAVVVDPNHNGGLPDLTDANLDFENGTDAVQLRDAGGNVVDAMAYQNPNQLLCATVDANGDPLVEGTPALDVFAGFSLERWPQGADTDDNAVDFTPQGLVSPGASREPRALVFDGAPILSGSSGGSVDLIFYTPRPNAMYAILVAATPPVGGEPLGVPVDPLTFAFVNLAATPNPFVVNFLGNLDATGSATATLNVPAGTTIPFPATLYVAGISPVSLNGFPSNVVELTLTP